MSERVRVVWPSDAPVWDFEAHLKSSPAAAGLALRNVFFRGHQVLDKASVPVLLANTFPGGVRRLELFAEAAWPQQSPFGTPHIFVDRTFFGDEVVLEVAAGFRCEDGFRAYQRFYLHGDGRISVRLWVGTEGPPPEVAHIIGFLRLDLDIDGAPADLVDQFDSNGEQWTQSTHPRERAAHRNRQRRVFRQLDGNAQRGYWILPGPRDGSTEGILAPIAKHDLWFMRYHASEDRDGLEGLVDDDAWLDAQVTGELLTKHDVVTWYAVRVPTPTHGWTERWSPPVGPDLFPHDWWPPSFGEGGSGPGGGEAPVQVPPLPVLRGRIKHWRRTPWLLHEKGTDTFDLDLPPGATWAGVELENDGLWGVAKVVAQPNPGDSGRVRIVVEWQRPLWGHVEYRYRFLARNAFLSNEASTVSMDAADDVRPYTERLGPAGVGGADFTSDYRVKRWGDDF